MSDQPLRRSFMKLKDMPIYQENFSKFCQQLIIDYCVPPMPAWEQ